MCINASLPPFLNGKGATMLRYQRKTIILKENNHFRETVFFHLIFFFFFVHVNKKRTVTKTARTK